MRYQTAFAVRIDGFDITERMRNFVQSIIISDKAGASADTATIVLDDSAGNLAFPRHNAICSIRLGLKGRGMATAFEGNIDEVRSSGGRDGKVITIEAKGVDTSGKIKQPQSRHFDDMTILEILQAAGEPVGITDVRVDQELSSIQRKYEIMDHESFMVFGERLAKEIGGTFKMRNDIAIMAKKNSGRTPGGLVLPSVVASHGENLHDWEIAPYVGRHRYKVIEVRYYDRKAAKWNKVQVETGIEGSDATAVGTFEASSKELATFMANDLKAQSERRSGVGRVIIEGNVAAQPEAICQVSGVRKGVDGAYRIEDVQHTYSRLNGFTTTLTLAHPL